MNTAAPARPAALAALTGLRAFAAGWVVLFHFRREFEALAPWLGAFDQVWRAGYLGVDLFFPLSGFILAYNYADRMTTWSWRRSADFLRNRVARVWPAHVVALHIDLATAAARGQLGIGPGGHRRTLSAYLQNLLMVQNWFNDRPSFNGPAWSISSEWFAYLTCPPLFLLLARVRRARSALLLTTLAYAAMLATFATLALPNGNLEHMFYVRIMGEFVGGLGLCLAWRRGGLRLGRLAGPLALAIFLATWLVPATHSGDYWLAPALGVFVAALASASDPLTRLLSRPLLVRAGEASYCLYLTHYLVRDVVAALTRWGTGAWWSAALALLAIVAVLGAAAWALHTWVEVPARRLLHARGG